MGTILVVEFRVREPSREADVGCGQLIREPLIAAKLSSLTDEGQL